MRASRLGDSHLELPYVRGATWDAVQHDVVG
jgi:hypothetical protein